MDNAGLDDREWPHAFHDVGESFQPVRDDEEHVSYATILQIDQHAHPKLGALTTDAGPQPQDVLTAVHGDPDSRVDGPVRDLTVTHLDHDGVDEHGDVHGIEGTRRPFRHLGHELVGAPRDWSPRDGRAVDFPEMR